MWLNAASNDKYYEYFDEIALQSHCRGDTLFILGSGASLATLPSDLLMEMQHNTTLSLNYTLLQSFIRADFHLIRELGAANDLVVDIRATDLKKLGSIVAMNPCYKHTLFLVQGGYHAWAANLLIGWRCLPRGTKLFRYRNRIFPGFRSLGLSFKSVTHGASTITDCVNLGYLMGFKKIVLCGLDLYDRKYFWHVDGASFIPLSGITDSIVGDYGKSSDVSIKHRASGKLLDQMAQWRQELETAGVVLYVQNPRSLLIEVLPVYSFD
jgi:hypothetical protein